MHGGDFPTALRESVLVSFQILRRMFTSREAPSLCSTLGIEERSVASVFATVATDNAKDTRNAKWVRDAAVLIPTLSVSDIPPILDAYKRKWVDCESYSWGAEARDAFFAELKTASELLGRHWRHIGKFADYVDIEARGVCFENERGVEKNHARAVGYFRRAADAGNLDAQCYLASCYMNGKGITADLTEAIWLYQITADSGSARAQNRLELRFEEVRGVENDIAKAVAHYRKATDVGNVAALCDLGLCCLEGKGVIADRTEAIRLYQLAANSGCPRALNRVGECFEKAAELKKNLRKAVERYRRAADMGHLDA